jgi:putative lipoic acid-binding regulatory protein
LTTMKEDDLNRLKEKLEETTAFPSVYMFKLIVPSENRSIALVENIFGEEADMLTKESGKGNYTSITVKQVVISADEIIDIYRKAAGIKGVIFL